MRNLPSLFTLSLILISLGAVSALFSASLERKTANPIAAGFHELQVSQSATAQERPLSALVAPLDLPALTKEADLIVVGRVESVKNRDLITVNVEGRPMQAQRRVASLHVDRVIKGQADMTTLSFDFLMPQAQSAYRNINASQYAMFFLRKDGERDYAILNPYYPFVVASSNTNVTDENDLDRVVTVVGRTLIEPTSPLLDRRSAVNVLSSARTDLADKILRQATKDNDAVVRLQALSTLLNRGDISMLDMAERLLLRPPPDTEEYLLANLSSALEGIKDLQAIPTLKRLLSSKDPNTRLGAAIALRHMRVSDAIDALIVALEDSNRKVRYEAVIGLAEVTREDKWAPSISVFEIDEQKYLDHWKTWAKAR